MPNRMTSAEVTLGIDTHADVHVAAALDHHGRLLGTHVLPSTPKGYASLEAWAAGLGTVKRVGLEGTGCYGAGLSRWMRQIFGRICSPTSATASIQVCETPTANTTARMAHPAGNCETG